MGFKPMTVSPKDRALKDSDFDGIQTHEHIAKYFSANERRLPSQFGLSWDSNP